MRSRVEAHLSSDSESFTEEGVRSRSRSPRREPSYGSDSLRKKFLSKGSNDEHLLNIKRNTEINLHRSNQPDISISIVVRKETGRWQAKIANFINFIRIQIQVLKLQ